MLVHDDLVADEDDVACSRSRQEDVFVRHGRTGLEARGWRPHESRLAG